MHTKMKVGDVEIVRPDESLVELTNKIIDQNQIIVETNAIVLKMLVAPIMVMTSENEPDQKGEENGENVQET